MLLTAETTHPSIPGIVVERLKCILLDQSFDKIIAQLNEQADPPRFQYQSVEHHLFLRRNQPSKILELLQSARFDFRIRCNALSIGDVLGNVLHSCSSWRTQMKLRL